MAGTYETPGGSRSPHDVNGQNDTTPQHTTRQRRRMPPAEPPDCYGKGWLQVRDIRYGFSNIYQTYRVSPRTCYSCGVERRCLQQQSRMRRG
jgi:hypothetical protein